MNVLIIGGLGSMGRRYQAILSHLKIDYDIFDIALNEEPDIGAFDKWIIASPTETHYEWCSRAIQFRKTFLVEKPLSKSIDECQILVDAAKRAKVDGFIGCNYNFLVKRNTLWRSPPSPSIYYNYYNHGKDEMEWDCCQLLYLDEMAVIETTSPIWNFKINNKIVRYDALESSYIAMVHDFIDDKYENLWTLEDGLKMTQTVWKKFSAKTTQMHEKMNHMGVD